MTHAIALSSSSGEPIHAELAIPAGDAPKGAMIVVHEWWGLNDDIRRITDDLAKEGYLALAVDLYGGRFTTDASEAMQLANEMKTTESMKVVAAAIEFLKAQPRSNGKVGIMGFCLGGGQALAAASSVPGLRCAVPFYGLPIASFQAFGPNSPHILGHYSESDAHVTPERTRALRDKAAAAGASFELHFYPGPHAFMRRADPAAFHEASATLAWARTLEFLGRELQ